MSNKDNFKFFVPFEIEKAKDSQGNEVMKIAGIASTIDRDSDGEVLDPSGFDLSYFMNNGFINWHHQAKDKPEAIIGEPTKAEIRPEGLYVEGELYPDSKLAKQVYDLAKSLEKSSKKRRLGFSIEGKVIERDELDNNFVKKAKITGLAITPTPKNANTIVDIIKGEYNDLDDDLKALSNSNSAVNGGSTTILDVTKPNGDRIVVDSNYNIKVFSKSVDTDNAGILSPASVEGKLKELESSSKIEEKIDTEDKKKDKFVSLNKSEIFVELLKATDNSELTKSIINKIKFTDMSKPTVSLEQLQKALSDIGVEVDTELLKGENQDFDTQVAESEKEKAKEESESSKKEEEEESEDKKLEKAISEKESELKILKSQYAELIKAKEAAAAESPEAENKKEASAEDINAEVDRRLGDVEKGLKDEFEKGQQDMFSKFEELFKGFTEKVDERLSAIENQPGQRKSAPSVKYIEKAFGGAEDKNNEGKTVISLSTQRQQLSNILLAKSGIEKGETNEFYANAMMELEATGTISKAVVTDLYANENILVTQ